MLFKILLKESNKLSDLHLPSGFNGQQLFEYLEQFTPEERKKRDVFIRVAEKNIHFNVKTLDYIEDSTYGFFNVEIPCFVLNHEVFSPVNPEDIGD